MQMYGWPSWLMYVARLLFCAESSVILDHTHQTCPNTAHTISKKQTEPGELVLFLDEKHIQTSITAVEPLTFKS